MKKTSANSTYPKGGVSCSKEILVVNQPLVFQIKFCGKGPALRVAAKRYATLMKLNQFLIFLLLCGTCVGQSANFKIVRTNYPEQFADFDKFQFTVNETTFQATDTGTYSIAINSNGLDVCKAILNNDTLVFLSKFLANVTYIIKPGCCCAQFTITPEGNCSRGYVRLVNSTAKDVMLSVAEISTDTVSANTKSDYIFASESAMCLFKPATILIAELQYGDLKYQYQTSSEVNYDSLWREQSQLVIGVTHFLFLHGELITVEFKSNAQFQFKLDGYKEN